MSFKRMLSDANPMMAARAAIVMAEATREEPTVPIATREKAQRMIDLGVEKLAARIRSAREPGYDEPELTEVDFDDSDAEIGGDLESKDERHAPRSRPLRTDSEQAAAVQVWARRAGYDVRGRTVPSDIVAAYRAAHQGQDDPSGAATHPPDILPAGQRLKKGESLTSANGAYTLTLQADGDLVLESRGHAIWATGTKGQDVERAQVQPDGNFVLYTAEKPVWDTGTKGKKDVRLVLQDDRNLVLYTADGPAWSTKTDTDAPPPVAEPEAAEATTDADAPAFPHPGQHVESPAARTYTVQSGDTLWAISERFYGDGSKYRVIADASGISDPDLIQPGLILLIP